MSRLLRDLIGTARPVGEVRRRARRTARAA